MWARIEQAMCVIGVTIVLGLFGALFVAMFSEWIDFETQYQRQQRAETIDYVWVRACDRTSHDSKDFADLQAEINRINHQGN